MDRMPINFDQLNNAAAATRKEDPLSGLQTGIFESTMPARYYVATVLYKGAVQ